MNAKFILSLLCSGIFSIAAQAAVTNSISQWGITWKFSEPREYGTFANGDYWVLGPVTITEMTPGWDGNNHGWEVNPSVQSAQGFHGTTAATNGVRPSLPFTLATNASLVKVISNTNATTALFIKTAAVLTILTEVPPGNGSGVFRPPYVGTNKPLFQVSSLRKDLLPSFAPVGVPPTLESVRTNFSKALRMDHHASVPRKYRPTDVMIDYQPQNTPVLNDAMLRLMLNDSYEAKLPALVQFTQHTIDRAYAVLLGYRRLDDGHNPNHRVLAAWAATMLDIGEIKSYLTTATNFHEDFYLYKGENGPLWGELISEGEKRYWDYVTMNNGGRSNKDPYGYIDGGKLSSVGASYQNITSQSLKGQALVYRLFPELINCIPAERWSNLNLYAERWVTHGVWASPDPSAPFDGIVTNYGITFGPDGSGSYKKGAGRFTQFHGANRDGGQYKSAFAASMWDAYAGTIPRGGPRPPSLLRVLN